MIFYTIICTKNRMTKKGRIYKIVNIKTSDIYIGSTIQELKDRYRSHKSNAKSNKNGLLYDCIRKNGIENFFIELIEEFNFIDNNTLTSKEKEYYDLLKPSLNSISPRVKGIKEFGRIYKVSDMDNQNFFYIGSTTSSIEKRFSEHISASKNGTAPLYKYMRDNKNNFNIELIENDIPVPELINRENFWIQALNPTLNKNLFLCRTEKERDKAKYEKNKDKISAYRKTQEYKDKVNLQRKKRANKKQKY